MSQPGRRRGAPRCRASLGLGKVGEQGDGKKTKPKNNSFQTIAFYSMYRASRYSGPGAGGAPRTHSGDGTAAPARGGYGGAEVALAGGRQAGRGPESPCPRAQGAAAATSCLWAEPKCACSSRSSAHSPGEADGRGEGARGSAPPGAWLGAQGEAVGPGRTRHWGETPAAGRVVRVPLPSPGRGAVRGVWGSCGRRGHRDRLTPRL